MHEKREVLLAAANVLGEESFMCIVSEVSVKESAQGITTRPWQQVCVRDKHTEKRDDYCANFSPFIALKIHSSFVRLESLHETTRYSHTYIL